MASSRKAQEEGPANKASASAKEEPPESRWTLSARRNSFGRGCRAPLFCRKRPRLRPSPSLSLDSHGASARGRSEEDSSTPRTLEGRFSASSLRSRSAGARALSAVPSPGNENWQKERRPRITSTGRSGCASRKGVVAPSSKKRPPGLPKFVDRESQTLWLSLARAVAACKLRKLTCGISTFILHFRARRLELKAVVVGSGPPSSVSTKRPLPVVRDFLERTPGVSPLASPQSEGENSKKSERL